MSTYVALLRAVNVAGYGKVRMADLRGAFEAIGCSDVSTYIQSGNVVFTSPEDVRAAGLSTAVSEELGAEVTVLLRTAAEMTEVPRRSPFTDVDLSKVHVGFLTGEPATAELQELDLERYQPEHAVVDGSEVFLHLPDGVGRARLPAYLGRRLTPAMTVRNWRTVNKLVELAAEVSD